ncbi:PD-(D/E)XK nuclease family protein [Arcanobacterium haemolyticum]|nr:PD-(D/E)XK nuclease family protein [Arcanobacterium haemolyticum]
MARTAALSPSRAKDFKQCPLMFRFRVIDKLPEPPSLEALRGTLVHSVLEHLFDLPPMERTRENACASIETRWSEHLATSPTDRDLFESEDHFSTWLESARDLVGNYFAMEKPQFLAPKAREQFVNTTLPSGLHIRGIVDRIDEAPNGATRVVDYKTGKSPAPRYQADAIFQMRFYAAALYLSTSRLPARTQLIYLKDGRTLTYDPVPQDVDTLASELDTVWSNIAERLDSGHFETQTGPLCGWCKFKDLCPAFGGEAPAMSEEGAQALRTAHV